MASCALIPPICLTRTGFKISIIAHYSHVDTDAYFEMLLYHPIADHWWKIGRCRLPIILKDFKPLFRQTERLFNWIWVSTSPVSITEQMSVCKITKKSGTAICCYLCCIGLGDPNPKTSKAAILQLAWPRKATVQNGKGINWIDLENKNGS